MTEREDGSIVIKAKLDDGALVTGLKKLGSVTKSTFKAASIAIASVAGAMGAGMGAVGKIASDFAATTDRIDKGSARLGMTVQQYQEWDYILGQCGGSIEALEMGMKTLNAAIVGVKEGNETNIQTLQQLQTLSGKHIDLSADQATQYEQVVLALANVADEQMRAKLATELFGRSGTDILPMLKSGEEGILALKQRSHELGLVLDEELVANGVALGDMFADLKSTAKALTNEAIAPLIPQLTTLAESTINMMHGVEGAEEQMKSSLNAVVLEMGNIISSALPVFLEAGGSIIKSMADGLIEAVPDLTAKIPDIIEGIIDIIAEYGPKLIQAGFDILKSLITGIWDNRGQIVDCGKNIILGLVEGIKSLAEAPIQAIKDVGSNILKSIKDFFGIHSPSRVMMSIGEYISQGLAEGIKLKNGMVISAAEAQALGIENVFVDLEKDGKVLGAAVSNAVLDGFVEAEWDVVVEEKTRTLAERMNDLADSFRMSFTDAISYVGAGIESVGYAMAQGEDGWASFAKAGLSALADLLQALAYKLAAMAVSSYPNFAQMALSSSASVAAFAGAGYIKGLADKYANGGIVKHKPGIPDTGDHQLVGVNAGELILNRAQQGAIASQLTGEAISDSSSSGVINMSFTFGEGYSADEITTRIYRQINLMQRRGALPAWSVR